MRIFAAMVLLIGAARAQVTPPVLLKKVEPVYPAAASAARVEGTVRLSATVGEDGTARDILVVSSPAQVQDASAIEAVSHWQFRAGRNDGEPVAVPVQIEVSFGLQEVAVPRTGAAPKGNDDVEALLREWRGAVSAAGFRQALENGTAVDSSTKFDLTRGLDVRGGAPGKRQ